ncbi:blue copper protein-like [Telopea speciosissima]|uniref:blue copper protein-like n=1 Tax=Telopea speciosissima TaxID=54955 RepID=UPI001CC5C829|nr:blue copper protein-like [Telopea speciosissima]XP_043720671.1 blue copper protein-like [Telopea speciosissima]
MESIRVAGVLLTILALYCVIPSLATDYTVGDGSGWTTNVDYNSWTSGKTFAVGDNLVFNYVGGHTVDEVTKNDYSSCTAGNSLSTDNSGATTITLKTTGTHYFMCGAYGHCASGMKLAVTVAGGEATSTTPSTGSSPRTITSPTTTSSSSSTSSSSPSTLSYSPIAIVFTCLAVFKFLLFLS